MKPVESQFFSRAKQRSSTSVLLPNASEITRLERMILNISVDDLKATIDGDNIRLYSDGGATLSPFLGRIKAGTTDTIEVGFNRTPSAYQDFIIMNDSFNGLTTVDEITIPSAVETYYVYYRIKRSKFLNDASTYKDVVIFELDYTDDSATLGRQTKPVLDSYLPSGTKHEVSLLSSDVTPIWHIPVGMFINPGQSDAQWIQLRNSQIELSIPHSNIFYDETNNKAFANVTPIGLSGVGFDLVETVPQTGITIPVNQVTNIYFYSNDTNVVTGDYLIMRFGDTTQTARPSQDKHIFIGTIETDADGKLINLHDYTMAGLPMYYLDND